MSESSEERESTFNVKVPKNREENHILKEGFEEDDNEDIAYINLRLIWPIAIAYALALTFFLFGVFSMEMVNHLHYERYAMNQILFSYGKTYGFCNNTFPYEDGLWPSFLRQLELKVITNICFRVAVCVPISLHIFVALVIRNYNRESLIVKSSIFLNAFNELGAIFIGIETLSLGMFAVVTIRFDYPRFYDAMLGLYTISAGIHMFLRTILSFTTDYNEPIQQFASVIRLACSIVFTWTSSQAFHNHQAFIWQPGCHGYVTRSEALTEYIAIITYICFTATLLIDIRNIRFICYPRTCSGECEPLVLQNFEKGGKYEHCRAFELQQRWINSMDEKDSRSVTNSTDKH